MSQGYLAPDHLLLLHHTRRRVPEVNAVHIVCGHAGIRQSLIERGHGEPASSGARMVAKWRHAGAGDQYAVHVFAPRDAALGTVCVPPPPMRLL